MIRRDNLTALVSRAAAWLMGFVSAAVLDLLNPSPHARLRLRSQLQRGARLLGALIFLEAAARMRAASPRRFSRYAAVTLKRRGVIRALIGARLRRTMRRGRDPIAQLCALLEAWEDRARHAHALMRRLRGGLRRRRALAPVRGRALLSAPALVAAPCADTS